MSQTHFRERFEGCLFFIKEGDVFDECVFYNCKIVMPNEYDFNVFGEFEGSSFVSCSFMTADYYFNQGGKYGPYKRI